MKQIEDVVRRVMTEVEWEKRHQETEANLRQILAHPDLAQEAFPDPDVREKVLPLFLHLRKLERNDNT